MLIIRFKGTEYLFTEDSLDKGGPLTTAEAYRNGTVSFAHWFPQRNAVERYGKQIGTGDDLEVVRRVKAPEPTIEGFDNLLRNTPWKRPETT